MENQDLLYKVRELLQNNTDAAEDWDPEMIWAKVAAKKKNRQVMVWTSSVAAAMLFFAILTTFIYTSRFAEKNRNDSALGTAIGDSTSISYRPVRDVELTLNSQEHFVSKANNKTTKAGRKLTKTSISAKFGKKRLSQTLAITTENVRKLEDELRSEVSANFPTETDDTTSSLYKMYKQARRERELRDLSVRLDETDNYNRFWLTVNQHVITNKFGNNGSSIH